MKKKIKDPIAQELGRRGGLASSKKRTKESYQAQARHMNSVVEARKKEKAEKYESA